MAGTSFADDVRSWDLLNKALKPVLGDMPHLAPEQAELEALIEQAKALDSEQRVLRGKVQDATKKRRDVQLKGIELRERVAVQIKGKLGPTNKNLVSYGIRARKLPKRRKKDGTDTPPPVPPHPTPGVEVQALSAPVAHGAQEVTSAPVPK
ncbi:MAG: hypothetical protein QOJ16_3806 [Acidobacteriota bacterium]|jgi:hypothetical protein|nr:hypothetical protein [Acidobacteriota bacterium]